jgi:DNA-binding XRE family transcriptional regulator
MKRPRLASIRVLTGRRLRLQYRDGRAWTVRFDEMIAESPGLAPLANNAAFRQARMEEHGWSVEWPELDLQIGADTLWLDAQAQNAPDENTRIFARWRARHGLTLAQAAEALGVTTRTLSAYGTGKRPVPRYMALACAGWEAKHASQTPQRKAS